MKYGVKNGLCYYYNTNEILKFEQSYKMGELVGDQIIYHRNGSFKNYEYYDSDGLACLDTSVSGTLMFMNHDRENKEDLVCEMERFNDLRKFSYGHDIMISYDKYYHLCVSRITMTDYMSRLSYNSLWDKFWMCNDYVRWGSYADWICEMCFGLKKRRIH
jgi:hypothetical protein